MFYDVYIELCATKNKKPSVVAAELGINKSNVSNWKNNGYTPRGEALQAIATYFGVTTDRLLGKEIDERGLLEGDALDRQLDGIEFALFGEVKEMSDAQKRDVLKFAQFIKEKGGTA